MVKIKVDIDWDENYGASSEQVDGCIALHDTLEGVKKGFESALKFHIEGMKEDNDCPAFLESEYEFEFILTVQALLKHFDGILSRAALSRACDINARQLGHYIQGVRKPRKTQRDKIINGIHKIGQDFLDVV